MSNARDLSELVRFFTTNSTSLSLNANSFTSLGNINAASITVSGNVVGNLIVANSANVGIITSNSLTASGDIVGGSVATAIRVADRTAFVTIRPPGLATLTFVAKQGVQFNSNSTCTKISYQWINAYGVSSNSAAPTIVGATTKLRLVNSSSGTMAVNYLLLPRVANGVLKNTNTIINAGDTIYWDIVSAGKNPGTGLVIIMDYYIGRPGTQL